MHSATPLQDVQNAYSSGHATGTQYTAGWPYSHSVLEPSHTFQNYSSAARLCIKNEIAVLKHVEEHSQRQQAEQIILLSTSRLIVHEHIWPINLHSNVTWNAGLALNQYVQREEALVMLPGYRNIFMTLQA